MVDLVKIRRKAKERKEREEAERRDSASAEAEVQSPPEAPASGGKGKHEIADAVAQDDPPKPKKPSRPKRKAADPPPVEPQVAEQQVSADAELQRSPAREATDTDPAAPEISGDARDRVEEFRRKAGLRRETTEATEEAGEESADDQRAEVLVFEISRERYAVEINHIREITPTRAFTRVPNADPSVIGIISLRGTIVTILDVRSRLGHREAPPATDDTRIIVVEQQSEIAGFVVDRVYRVLAIDRGSIEANPVVTAGEHSRYIRGVFRYNERITILLDLERLLEQQGV